MVVVFLIHWLATYVRIAAHEASDGSVARDASCSAEAADARTVPAASAGVPQSDGPTTLGGRAQIGALVLVVPAAASENVVSGLIADVFVPFAASLATLFPIGAIFAAAFPRNPFQGIVVGIIASTANGVIHLLMGVTDLAALGSGWWILLGASFGLIHWLRRDRSWAHPRTTVPGAILALGVVLTFSAPRVQEGIAAVPAPFDGPLHLLLLPVTRLLAAPEVPAGFWIRAEQQITRREAADGEPEPVAAWRDMVAGWIGCDGDAPGPLARIGLLPGIPDAPDARRQRFCAEFRRGERSGLLRSWLVILLFSVGLGIAPRFEARLRPVGGAASRTARLDRVCAAGIAALVVAAILLVHVLG